MSASSEDCGWTSPWRLIGEEKSRTAFRIEDADAGTGGNALEMGAPGALERDFPPVVDGTLRIELRVRLEKTGIDITDAETSVLKVYAGDAVDNWAYRWHYPFAWPEVGGNVFPRFYVIDSLGTRRKGLEPTPFEALPDRWYETAAILHMAAKTWEFWVDGVSFDAPEQLGHEMVWWQSSNKPQLSKVRLSNASKGKNWIDHIAVWHGDDLLTRSNFDGDLHIT